MTAPARAAVDRSGALLAEARQAVPRIERPAGLSDREVELIGLLARGLQTKQVARTLDISMKTGRRHVQNAYGPIPLPLSASYEMLCSCRRQSRPTNH